MTGRGRSEFLGVRCIGSELEIYFLLDAQFTLKNARKRLSNLKQSIEGGEYFDVDKITAYPHPRKHGVFSNDLPNPLNYISPEIGAIATESRAVLDQLLYAAIVSRLGRDPTNRPQFPICKKLEHFQLRIKPDLEGLQIDDITFIQQWQPYNGHDWLRLLKDMADSHKHRKNVFLRAPDGVTLHGSAVYSNTSTEDFFVLPTSGVRVPKSVQVNARFKGKITLEDGRPVIETLEIIHAEIASLLDLFKARFNLT